MIGWSGFVSLEEFLGQAGSPGLPGSPMEVPFNVARNPKLICKLEAQGYFGYHPVGGPWASTCDPAQAHDPARDNDLRVQPRP